MLPKENRLTKRSDFQKVFKNGETFQGRLFGLFWTKENPGELKIGIIVSNKVSKRAVSRNRIRRLLREVLRHRLGSIEPGKYLTFMVKKAALDADLRSFEKEVEFVLRKTKLLN